MNATVAKAVGRARVRARYWEPHILVLSVFLVFVLARYMQWGARRDILKTIRIEFVLGLLLTIICVFVVNARPVQLAGRRDVRNVLAAIGLLFFVMLTEIPFAADRTLAQNIFFDRVIKFAMLTFFMVTLIRSPRSLRWFMAAFLFACFYITQESTRGLINGGLVWQNQGVMRLHGAVPIYAHPNSLGGLAMGALPYCVLLFPTIRTRWIRLLLLPLAATSLICVIYSGSRTAYVALGVLLGFLWLNTRNKLKTAVIAVVIGAALMPLVPDQYVERFKSIGGEEAEGQSKATRIVILSDAWSIFLRNPLGVGVASFPAVRMREFGRKQDTHNLYLEVATNLGVQGLVVFGFLVWALLSALLRARRRFDAQVRMLMQAARRAPPAGVLRRDCDGHLDDLRFLTAITVATGGFIWVRLALGLFGMDLYEVYWWFAAGIAICTQVLAWEMTKRTRRLMEALDA
jgi:O-antigen ligase